MNSNGERSARFPTLPRNRCGPVGRVIAAEGGLGANLRQHTGQLVQLDEAAWRSHPVADLDAHRVQWQLSAQHGGSLMIGFCPTRVSDVFAGRPRATFQHRAF